MLFVIQRCTALGSLWCLMMRAHIMGERVSATRVEMTMAKITVSANSLRLRPTAPLMNTSGVNTMIRATLVEITVNVISFMLRTAAGIGFMPSSRWRTVFSSTTMASSTRNVTASTMPMSESVSMLNFAGQHGDHRAQQGDGQDDAGDHGLADSAEEEEDDQHHEDQRDGHGDLHVVKRLADRRGAVEHGLDRDRSRQLVLGNLQSFRDPVRHLHRIGAADARDRHDHALVVLRLA